ncbi:MAG: hypothetical protein ABMB14_05740 [Myxococcota bacterium]
MTTASTRFSSPALLAACALAGAVTAGCGHEYGIAQPVDVDPADVLTCGFTPISGTHASVYDCNPVFTGTGEPWTTDDGFVSVGFRAQIVLGHPFYQIWYSSRSSATNYGLGYAISTDGTTWEANPANPVIASSAGWDADLMDQVVVVWDDARGEYVLAYQGVNLGANRWGIGVLESPDGIGWSAVGGDGTDPYLDLTAPVDDIAYCWPVGFSWDATSGYFGYLAGGPAGAGVCQMYRFSAQDLGAGLQIDPSPVLETGPEPYDAAGISSGAVVKYDGFWYLFYVAFAEWGQGNGYQYGVDHSLNLATSRDGIHWTKDASNPLPVALSNPGGVSSVAAQVVGSRIHLWVTDYYEDLDQSAVGYYLYEPDVAIHP